MSGILVMAEHRGGELRPASLELIGAAQPLKAVAGGPLAVAIVGEAPETFASSLAVAGVDEILAVSTPRGEPDPDTMAAAIAMLIKSRAPRLVLLPHSVDSFGYAGAVAAAGGFGFATDVFQIRFDESGCVATRGGYGQKVNIEVDFPGRSVVVLAVRSGAFKAPQGESIPAVSVVPIATHRARARPIEYIDVASGDDVDMTTAEFILSIGRGIGEEAKVAQFKDLADALGATLGCSRPIADSGWLPKSRQVGQSGKTASACKLYVAMGVSGAIQHLAGMKHVNTIVAVNSDSAASIFNVATYGIVGDIFAIAEELRSHF